MKCSTIFTISLLFAEFAHSFTVIIIFVMLSVHREWHYSAIFHCYSVIFHCYSFDVAI